TCVWLGERPGVVEPMDEVLTRRVAFGRMSKAQARKRQLSLRSLRARLVADVPLVHESRLHRATGYRPPLSLESSSASGFSPGHLPLSPAPSSRPRPRPVPGAPGTPAPPPRAPPPPDGRLPPPAAPAARAGRVVGSGGAGGRRGDAGRRGLHCVPARRASD